MAPLDSAHLGFSHNVQALLMIYLFSALAGLAVVRFSKLPWMFLPSSWRFIFWCGVASQFAGCWALGNAYAILQAGIQMTFAEMPRFAALMAWGWRATWAGAIGMFVGWFSLRAIERALQEELHNSRPASPGPAA